MDEFGNITRCAYEEDRIYLTGVRHRYNKAVQMTPFIDPDGYANLYLKCLGIIKYFRVHHLVYFIWVEGVTRLDKNTCLGYDRDASIFTQIDHKDGNKLNNHYTNLEKVTLQENIRRAVSLGIHDSQTKARWVWIYQDEEVVASCYKLKGCLEWFAQLGLKANTGTLSAYIKKDKSWRGYRLEYQSNDYRKCTPAGAEGVNE